VANIRNGRRTLESHPTYSADDAVVCNANHKAKNKMNAKLNEGNAGYVISGDKGNIGCLLVVLMVDKVTKAPRSMLVDAVCAPQMANQEISYCLIG
jgi:hypothetical protein